MRPCWVGGPLVARPIACPYIPTGALTLMPQALVGVSGAWGSRDGPDPGTQHQRGQMSTRAVNSRGVVVGEVCRRHL